MLLEPKNYFGKLYFLLIFLALLLKVQSTKANSEINISFKYFSGYGITDPLSDNITISGYRITLGPIGYGEVNTILNDRVLTKLRRNMCYIIEFQNVYSQSCFAKNRSYFSWILSNCWCYTWTEASCSQSYGWLWQNNRWFL